MKLSLFLFLMTTVSTGQLLAQNNNSVVVTPGFVNELADRAATNNPTLRAADHLIEAAQQGAAAVRTWEDPTVRIGGMLADKMMREDEGDLFYGVEQKLPLFGKARAARDVAAADVAVERANADLRFQTVRKELAVATFKAALEQRTATITEQDLVLLETLAAVAEQRYENRTGTQLEVLRLQNERSTRLQQLALRKVAVTNSLVQLNRLVGRDLQHRFPPLELPDPGPELMSNARLLNLALKAEPTLKRMEREVEKAGAIAEQTRRARYPDFSIGLEGRNYTGSGEFREGAAYVAFNVPWGNRKKYESDFQREKARQAAIELERKDYALEVGNEVHRLVTEANAFRREALLYRDEIIPRARLAVESAQAAWQANAGSLIELLEARRMALDAELLLARAVSQQYQLLSELVLCCGLGDLEALEMFAVPVSNPSPSSEAP